LGRAKVEEGSATVKKRMDDKRTGGRDSHHDDVEELNGRSERSDRDDGETGGSDGYALEEGVDDSYTDWEGFDDGCADVEDEEHDEVDHL
jgi:hypothetical protein